MTVPNHEPVQRVAVPVTILVAEVRMACMESPEDRGGEVPVSLTYQQDDPYAVALVFHTSEGDITWMVARELLVLGASSPAGDGDVMIWPAVTPELEDAVVIRLQAPGGRLVLRLGRLELDEFLRRTLALVPAGSESDNLDLDALVADLLGSA